MAGDLQPLDDKFAIVGSDGRPTLYFIQWAQQKQIDIQGAITAEQFNELLVQYLLDHQLQEGSGIQITPDGNLTNSPTIAADVQEILDQITATRGAMLYRGLLGWAALLPGTAGYVLSTNGAGADPAWIAAAAGGSAWDYIPPTAAQLASVFNGAGSAPAVTDDANVGFILQSNNAGSGSYVSRIRAKALPSAATPWTVTAKVTLNGMASNYFGGGLYLVETATSKIASMGNVFDGAYYLDPWNGNLTAFSARGTRYQAYDLTWFYRIVSDGAGNLTFSVSQNGKIFIPLRTATQVSMFTTAASHIGIGCTILGAPHDTYTGVNCPYWVQVGF